MITQTHHLKYHTNSPHIHIGACATRFSSMSLPFIYVRAVVHVRTWAADDGRTTTTGRSMRSAYKTTSAWDTSMRGAQRSASVSDFIVARQPQALMSCINKMFVGRAVSITRTDSMDCVDFIDLSPYGAVFTPQTFQSWVSTLLSSAAFNACLPTKSVLLCVFWYSVSHSFMPHTYYNSQKVELRNRW